MIAQPSPTHAFRQDVTRSGPPVGVSEVDLIHPLEPCVKFLIGALLQGKVHPLRRGAGQHPHARPPPPPKILRHECLDRLGLEQLVFVIVLGFEEYRANAGPGQELLTCSPFAPSGVNREQRDHPTRGETDPAKEVHALGERAPRVERLVYDHGERPFLRTARQCLTFPPA